MDTAFSKPAPHPRRHRLVRQAGIVREPDGAFVLAVEDDAGNTETFGLSAAALLGFAETAQKAANSIAMPSAPEGLEPASSLAVAPFERNPRELVLSVQTKRRVSRFLVTPQMLFQLLAPLHERIVGARKTKN